MTANRAVSHCNSTHLSISFCMCIVLYSLFFFFFFTDTATTEIYTLSLHDALPISIKGVLWSARGPWLTFKDAALLNVRDRKSTRLNSSHQIISYAVFCLKKKKNNTNLMYRPRHEVRFYAYPPSRRGVPVHDYSLQL